MDISGKSWVEILALEYREKMPISKENVNYESWVEKQAYEKSTMMLYMYVKGILQKYSKLAVLSQYIFYWICHKCAERYSIRMDLGLQM